MNTSRSEIVVIDDDDYLVEYLGIIAKALNIRDLEFHFLPYRSQIELLPEQQIAAVMIRGDSQAASDYYMRKFLCCAIQRWASSPDLKRWPVIIYGFVNPRPQSFTIRNRYNHDLTGLDGFHFIRLPFLVSRFEELLAQILTHSLPAMDERQVSAYLDCRIFTAAEKVNGYVHSSYTPLNIASENVAAYFGNPCDEHWGALHNILTSRDWHRLRSDLDELLQSLQEMSFDVEESYPELLEIQNVFAQFLQFAGSLSDSHGTDCERLAKDAEQILSGWKEWNKQLKERRYSPL